MIESHTYLTQSRRIMTDEERVEVVNAVAMAPGRGVRIQGAPGIRKLRIALAGRGKRGGARIVYWFHSEDYPAVLIFTYAKNQAENLTAEQKRQLSRAATQIMKELGGQS